MRRVWKYLAVLAALTLPAAAFAQGLFEKVLHEERSLYRNIRVTQNGQERELLSAIPYQRSRAVLHTDERLMPRARKVWASWNVHLDDDGVDGPCLTYWINRLQAPVDRLGVEPDAMLKSLGDLPEILL